MTWTEPKLMAEVRFATRTTDGRLRQASFQGLRQDRIADDEPPGVGTTGAGAATAPPHQR